MLVLLITGNPKKTGSLGDLTDEAVRGAREAGAEVEELRLAEMNIGYCRFCLKCREDRKSGIAKCVQDDDLNMINEKVMESDGVILACPLSSGHANAVMKTFIERTVWTFGGPFKNYPFLKGAPGPRVTERKRHAVLITTSEAPAWLARFFDGAEKEMKEEAKSIMNAHVVDRVLGGDVWSHGDWEVSKGKAYRSGRRLVEAIKRQ